MRFETPRITPLLRDLWAGTENAREAVCLAAYAAIHERAVNTLGRYKRGRGRPVSLQPTMLTNDTLLALLRQRKGFSNSDQFFALAADFLKNGVREHWRRYAAVKRRHRSEYAPLDSHVDLSSPVWESEAEDLHQALQELRQHDQTQADVVETRWLENLTIQEAAARLGVSPATVERQSKSALSWLRRKLFRDDG